MPRTRVTLTRCAHCRRIDKVTLVEYVEQAGGGLGDEPVRVVAALCDDCCVVHWAYPL